MKWMVRSALMLLPLFVCACEHKTVVTQVQPLAPPIEDTPPPKTDAALPEKLSVQEPKTFPTQPPPKVVVKPEETAKKPKKKSPKPAPPAPAVAAPAQNTQVATEAPPAEVSAIGTLTSGEPDVQKSQTQNAIADVEKGLNQVNRKLSDGEEKTVAQIREYLKQARAALSTNDVDGANTLAKKAKFLLSELTE